MSDVGRILAPPFTLSTGTWTCSPLTSCIPLLLVESWCFTYRRKLVLAVVVVVVVAPFIIKQHSLGPLQLIHSKHEHNRVFRTGLLDDNTSEHYILWAIAFRTLGAITRPRTTKDNAAGWILTKSSFEDAFSTNFTRIFGNKSNWNHIFSRLHDLYHFYITYYLMDTLNNGSQRAYTTWPSVFAICCPGVVAELNTIWLFLFSSIRYKPY